MKIAAVILAAGGSVRLGGSNKLLLPIGGIPIIKRVVEAVLKAGYDPVAVVTGFEASRVRAVLSDPRLMIRHNRRWKTGMSSSIQTGIAALPEDVGGALIVLGDMPATTSATLTKLQRCFVSQDDPKIVYPTYRDRQANPVLFPKRFFPELLALKNDRGGKTVLRRHPEATLALEVDSEEVILDCDTREEYIRLVEKLQEEEIAAP